MLVWGWGKKADLRKAKLAVRRMLDGFMMAVCVEWTGEYVERRSS